MQHSFTEIDSLTTARHITVHITDFQVILKRTLQNYLKILKKCFLGTTWKVMLPAGSNLQIYTGVLPVVKGLRLLSK